MTPAVWSTVEVNDVQLPVFLGRTYEDHVTAWRDVDAAVQKNYWMLGAIAVRLERATGGRPGSRHPKPTAIQKFIRDVGIDRQTFQRYSRTYCTFAETRTTSGTRFIQQLSFKYFEVAARFYDVTEDAADAVAEAYDKKWSANELERQLASRANSGPKPFYLKAAYSRLWQFICTWPLSARKKAPEMLRRLAGQVEAHLPHDDDDMPNCLRELVAADLSDPIGLRDVETVQ